MDTNVDFSKMSNAEIKMKLLNYTNEYDVKKSTILRLVKDLSDLDILYIKGSNELKQRGVLNDGN